ncbi:uncharacterized protein EI97DRAFT_434732 [Westerdykella ornata]|uniref:Glutamyl-tRNA(Gln) amidotransferase subunit B, mitochondrial n=1 Tax=Westerdykella ornata TaxID=318751 RepID=A0A6A6JDZ1_WESOR|nr:uncharacterized protein EI97DRAFT_434732 [Westerdykella ornata]KAF2274830.1 hypothetical protein EI97DRAFT_434732 [Westerdykella ornata]
MLNQLSRTGHATFARRPYICQECLRRLQSRHIRSIASPAPAWIRPLSTASDDRTPPKEDAPFRKALKDAAKKKRLENRGKAQSSDNPSGSSEFKSEKWELTVGIEIHAELNTARKLFSSAATSVNDTPNTHVALFDAAFPGSQPHFQRETLIPALRAALALNCEIQHRSSFDRKHYFYQDQPAGYQITQYYEPFARDGHITLYPHDFPGGVSPEGGPVTIGIKQVQMEQDTAKTIQQPPSTHLLDFNRVSHPLIEIITLPQIHNPVVAAACVRKIQAILKAVDAVTAGMEMGGLRADVNVSVRRRDSADSSQQSHSYHGVTGLGQRTEIKNLPSIKAVEDAIIAERDRQIDLLERGGIVDGETRGFTQGSKTTRRLRGKEGEIDYRYMPDPDIAPVVVGKDLVQHLKSSMPLLSDDVIEMLVDPKRYGLTAKDAGTLVVLDDGDRLDYYLEVVEILRRIFSEDFAALSRVGKMAGNWVLMELGALFKTTQWSADRVSPSELASLIAHVLRKQITGRTAKLLLAQKFDGDARPVDQIIVDEDLLLRPLSRDEYLAMAQQLLEEKSDVVRDIVEKGKHQKVKWFVGQMMARGAEGTVEPGTAEEVLRLLLQLPPMEEQRQQMKK